MLYIKQSADHPPASGTPPAKNKAKEIQSRRRKAKEVKINQSGIEISAIKQRVEISGSRGQNQKSE